MPEELRAAIVLFASLLDERQRRLLAGLEALKCGWGGTGPEELPHGPPYAARAVRRASAADSSAPAAPGRVQGGRAERAPTPPVPVELPDGVRHGEEPPGLRQASGRPHPTQPVWRGRVGKLRAHRARDGPDRSLTSPQCPFHSRPLLLPNK